MSMQAASLEALEKANVSTTLVRALAQVFEFEFAARRNDLATKHDLIELRTELRGEMADMRHSLELKIEGVRTEVAGVRTEVESVRTEVESVRTELQSVKGEIYSTFGNLSRQMYLAILGQMAVLLGAAYFFVAHLR